jgi:hypothetical protein
VGQWGVANTRPAGRIKAHAQVCTEPQATQPTSPGDHVLVGLGRGSTAVGCGRRRVRDLPTPSANTHQTTSVQTPRTPLQWLDPHPVPATHQTTRVHAPCTPLQWLAPHSVPATPFHSHRPKRPARPWGSPAMAGPHTQSPPHLSTHTDPLHKEHFLDSVVSKKGTPNGAPAPAHQCKLPATSTTTTREWRAVTNMVTNVRETAAPQPPHPPDWRNQTSGPSTAGRTT